MNAVPLPLFYDPELSFADKFIGIYVYAVLGDRISPKKIMDDLKVSNKTVVSSLCKLVDKGYLTRPSRFEWKTAEFEESVAVECKNYTLKCRNYIEKCTDYTSKCRNYTEECKNYTLAEEETETEQESKKERSKERSKEKEREKEKDPKNSTDPYGSVLSEKRGAAEETVVIEPLPASDLLPATGGEETAPCPYQAIQNMFNRICVSYPHIKGIDGKRRQLVSGRWTSYPNLDVFREVFENAENSSFMKGQSKSGWTADFDWIMKPSNFQKVLEGNYNDRVQNHGYGTAPDKDPFVAYLDAVIAGEA